MHLRNLLPGLPWRAVHAQAMAEEAFKRIEEANRILSDARERRKYDASLGIPHHPTSRQQRDAYFDAWAGSVPNDRYKHD